MKNKNRKERGPSGHGEGKNYGGLPTVTAASTAYEFFQRENTASIREQLRARGDAADFAHLAKATYKAWKDLGESERGYYEQLAANDQSRFRQESHVRDEAVLEQRNRARKEKNERRDQNTLRVTNISEEVTEAELQQLFQTFGRISRVYLPKDKETMQSRGFAFVSYVYREDAAMAMEKLQGYDLYHLILKLEWASAMKDPGSEGTVYRSGHAKALAQDTEEKVSFASNLTK